MGVTASVSVASTVNTARNQTYQEANNVCSANCSQINTGTTIILNNTTAGNITFTQECEANASCYMKNALDSAVVAVQKAVAASNATPAMFPGTSLNVSAATSVQDINNQLTQIMNNLCTADVQQETSDTMIYATDSTVGNIGFVQKGNATADCVMENAGRMKIQLQQQGNATAQAGTSTAAIVAIVIAIIIIAIAAAAARAAKRKEAVKTEGQPCTTTRDCTTGNTCLNNVCVAGPPAAVTPVASRTTIVKPLGPAPPRPVSAVRTSTTQVSSTQNLRNAAGSLVASRIRGR